MAAMTQTPTLDMPVPRGATDDKTGIAVGAGSVDVDAYIDFQCPSANNSSWLPDDIIDQLLDRQVIRSSVTR